jgi:thiamine biosynthesis lipoprotein
VVNDIHSVAFTAMGSRCDIRVVAEHGAAARLIAAPAIAEVRRIENKYSRYRSDNIISRINAAAGLSAVECDDETEALLAYADRLHAASEGRLDITSGVLRKVWDFRNGGLPQSGALSELLPLVGWNTSCTAMPRYFCPCTVWNSISADSARSTPSTGPPGCWQLWAWSTAT